MAAGLLVDLAARRRRRFDAELAHRRRIPAAEPVRLPAGRSQLIGRGVESNDARIVMIHGRRRIEAQVNLADRD
jgi:hypothetical protein